MKKYLAFFVAFLVGIIALETPVDGHAMTVEDMDGQVYKMTSYAKGDDGNKVNWSGTQYLFVNNTGKCVTVDDPSGLDATDSDDKKEIKKLNKKIKTLTTNKKKAEKIFKKSGKQIKIDGLIMKGIIQHDDGHGAQITSEQPLTLVVKLDDPSVRYFAADGESLNVYYDLVPADQSMQYQFTW